MSSPLNEPTTLTQKWYGLIDFKSALEEQDRQRQEIQKTHKIGHIMGLEHSPVITLGVRGSSERDLKTTAQQLEKEEIQIIKCDRGGQATLHSPGQLVIYPILSLRQLQLGVRSYIQLLIRASQTTLSRYGLETFERPNEPGLYSSQGKIAFFGVRILKGVSLHGLSINISNDLSLFGHIHSCGIQNEQFDRVQNHAPETTVAQVFNRWTETFKSDLKAYLFNH